MSIEERKYSFLFWDGRATITRTNPIPSLDPSTIEEFIANLGKSKTYATYEDAQVLASEADAQIDPMIFALSQGLAIGLSMAKPKDVIGIFKALRKSLEKAAKSSDPEESAKAKMAMKHLLPKGRFPRMKPERAAQLIENGFKKLIAEWREKSRLEALGSEEAFMAMAERGHNVPKNHDDGTWSAAFLTELVNALENPDKPTRPAPDGPYKIESSSHKPNTLMILFDGIVLAEIGCDEESFREEIKLAVPKALAALIASQNNRIMPHLLPKLKI